MYSNFLNVDAVYSAPVSDNTGKTSNRIAAERLYYLKMDAEIINSNTHLCIFYDLVQLFSHDARDMEETDPAKYSRLQQLLTATQWLDSPEEVAKVIRGESDVSKEIPANLLKLLQSDKVDNIVRKDFAYYLAYKAACLEN
jgi:hypothetical protein